MDESFLKPVIIPSDSDLFENDDHNEIWSNQSDIPNLCSSMTVDKLTDLTSDFDCENAFFNDCKLSKMTRWQSESGSLNNQSNSSNQEIPLAESYLTNEFFATKNVNPPSILDILLSPMSRLSTSSSLMSFKSLGNSKIPDRSAITKSSDQLILPNENLVRLSSIDNDLQRVPPSYMYKVKPQSQIICNTGRSSTMPSWRGSLPMKLEPFIMDPYHTNTSYSQKVFLGGIPTELSEADLLLVLRKFGRCNIKWPKNQGTNNTMPSFCHVVYRESRSVSELLKHCTRQQRTTIDYFLHIYISPSLLPTTNCLHPIRSKSIQVVPWNTKDNVYAIPNKNMTNNETPYQDWSRTIFVSPLHGKMTAFSLSSIMSDIFGAVLMAQINTDKYGYPTGTGTVLFYDSHSYMRAVAAGVIDIKCDCFHKLLDIDPFLRENEPCAYCPSVADAFCRNFHCLRSYCKQCWINRHGLRPLADHPPVTRKEQIL